LLVIAAPKGAFDSVQFTASLKRCPDTDRAFFSSLISRCVFFHREVTLRAET